MQMTEMGQCFRWFKQLYLLYEVYICMLDNWMQGDVGAGQSYREM